MKYRITRLEKKNAHGRAMPKIRGALMPVCLDRKALREYAEGLDFGFFGTWQDNLPIPYKKRHGAFKKMGVRISSFLAKARSKKREHKKLISSSALLGALCASCTVAAVSVLFVLYTVLIQDYFTPYRTITIPHFEGEVYPSSEVFASEDCFSYTVTYEHSDGIPEGEVISQTPPPDVLRKLYLLQGKCEIELVVSLGEKKYKMPSIDSQNLREVLLDFKNTGIRFEISEEYSADVPAGEIISATGDQNGVITSRDTVKIIKSLGAYRKTLTVPNICSLSETRARNLIQSLGFSVGKVSYVASDAPAGTVISQTPTAHSSLYEGQAISFSVSTGRAHTEKRIPDLHGLSIAKATELLSSYGLALGNVFYIESAAPSGTVISQSPIPQSTITPDIYSVDIYVSN